MRSITILALAFTLVVSLSARADDIDAKTVAQEVLDKGAALFDKRDATAMAATYTEDAQLEWVEKDSAAGGIKIDTKKGRDEIETAYRDLFKDQKEATTSKNTVEFARFVSPDLMVIHGVFQPNVANDSKFQFVQLRLKKDDKWMMKSLTLFVIAKD
jgi:ketosteroid isomerase-like protein